MSGLIRVYRRQLRNQAAMVDVCLSLSPWAALICKGSKEEEEEEEKG